MYIMSCRHVQVHKGASVSEKIVVFQYDISDLLLFDLFHLCHIAISVSCNVGVSCLEKADPLALLYVMFNCVCVTVPYSVLGQVWYLIVSVPDICLLSYSTIF